jgi:hypothetical protein
MMTGNEFETAVRTLLDIEAIKQLHAKYTFYVDGNRWDDVLDLFADDAVGDWGLGGEGTRGRHEGKEEIARFFKQLAAQEATMFRHMVIQPLIDVSGDKAHAKWYMFGFGTYNLPEGKTPAWTHGKYENDLVKENGKWKIKYLRFKFTFQTPYHEGWERRPSILPTVFREEQG